MQMRTAVIGAGVVGLSTAYALLRHGSEVVVFETDRPMGARSAGSSRIFRLAHADSGLVAYAAAAAGLWADWTHRAGNRLVGQQTTVVTGPSAPVWADAMADAGVDHTLLDEVDPALGLPVSELSGPALVDPSGGVIDVGATNRFLRAAIGRRVWPDHIYRLEPHDDWVTVYGAGGVHEVDRVVIAAGRGSLELAAQVDLYLPTDLAHNSRFTFRLKDQDAAPPCWLDGTESWRSGIRSYQHLSGPGLWSIGLSLPPEDEDWERGRDEVADESRELVRSYVREALVGVGDELVEEIHCDSPASLGDGVHVATVGPVTAVWGANLFKHAPAIGQTLANAAITDTSPQVPRTE
ncbi:NAD(P)/FAD-dependent oxidoreductase [Actinophytocola oryzae]|uniref:Sarcosine oxidase n=1 Tax=Actinophytocola oryzae TaxID=502181 RepID=A0A4R7VMK2_9PSEU|nr:FAD-dependent oxidoreductase [Actinophytocola oryzae]TDV50843.1 sarcosine oxidase [Actinophytocola oryzae]